MQLPHSAKLAKSASVERHLPAIFLFLSPGELLRIAGGVPAGLAPPRLLESAFVPLPVRADRVFLLNLLLPASLRVPILALGTPVTVVHLPETTYVFFIFRSVIRNGLLIRGSVLGVIVILFLFVS